MAKNVQRAEQILKKSVQRAEQMEHKKGEHHMGFYLGDVRLWRFLSFHLKGYGGLFIVKRHHLFCWFYFTTILHFAAPLTAMKIPSAGAST